MWFSLPSIWQKHPGLGAPNSCVAQCRKLCLSVCSVVVAVVIVVVLAAAAAAAADHVSFVCLYLVSEFPNLWKAERCRTAS